MPNEVQSIIPMISYEDGVVALDWLAAAFGFRERTRMIGPGGRLAHAGMEYGGRLVLLATPPPEYECPKRHPQRGRRRRKWVAVPWVIDGALVYVDDVDEHYERAKRAGAVILSEPEDGGPGRRYRAEDIEGHRWMFLERQKS